MSKALGITVDELDRMIRHENLLRGLLRAWQARETDGGAGFGAQMDAAVLMVNGAPAPSAQFRNLSTRKRALSEDECRSLVNGVMLALCLKEPDHVIRVPSADIFSAYAQIGTLAVAISDDDQTISITGMKAQ